jgi:hypothetical protein
MDRDMFVRWKHRTLAARNGSGANVRSLYAVIVKNHRVEGRTRQKVVKYLAHITESDIDRPEHREYFWQRVDQGLAGLGLGREERAEIEAKLAGVVRRPDRGDELGELLMATAGICYEPDGFQLTRDETRSRLSTV